MKTVQVLTLMLAAILLQACNNNAGESEQTTTTSNAPAPLSGQAAVSDEESSKNIVQIAAGSEMHTTLVAAVKAAGLTDVLANNGPLTVFAPINDAFDALPEGTVDNLLKPENKKQLVKIIHYHAAPGTYKDNLLKDGMNLFMATGDNAKIKILEDGTVTVNDAKILATIPASNGVVHIIDKVIFATTK